MDLKLKLSVFEKVDLELFFSHLTRRYVESENCITDENYKRLDNFCMSADEFKLIRKLQKALVNTYDKSNFT